MAKKTGAPVEKWNKNIKDTSDYTPSQIATLHTLSKLKDFSEIHAEKEGEGNELLLKKTRELWKDFAVHGTAKPDGKGGYAIEAKTDLDGQGFIEILKQAGLDTSNVNYIAHDKHLLGGFTGDASGRDGVSTPDAGESMIDDHHGKKSGRDTSATKVAYEHLVDFGLIGKDSETIKKFVELVTDEDNQNYTDKEIEYLFDPKNRRFSRSIIGLSKYLTTGQILELLDKNKDYKKALPPEVLKKIKGYDSQSKQEKTLEEFAKLERGKVLLAESAIRKMSQEGFEIDSGTKFGKILIDTGTMKPLGNNGEKIGYFNKIEMKNESFLPVKAAGYGAYIVWIPEQKRFKVFTNEPLGDIEFDQGFNVRGSFWNKPGNDGKELTVKLEDILSKLSGKDTKIEGALKAAMEKETKERSDLSKEAIEINAIIAELQKRIDPANFDEKTYGKKYAAQAIELKNKLEKIITTRMGQGKKYMQWPKKTKAIRDIKKEIELFISEAEKVTVGNKSNVSKKTSPDLDPQGDAMADYIDRNTPKKTDEEIQGEAMESFIGRNADKMSAANTSGNKNNNNPHTEGNEDAAEGEAEKDLAERKYKHRDPGDIMINPDKPEGEPIRKRYDDLLGATLYNKDSVVWKKDDDRLKEQKSQMFAGSVDYAKHNNQDDWIRLDDIDYKNRKVRISWPGLKVNGVGATGEVESKNISFKKFEKILEKYSNEIPLYKQLMKMELRNKNNLNPHDWIRIDNIDYYEKKATVARPGLRADGIGVYNDTEKNKEVSFSELDKLLKDYTVGGPSAETPATPDNSFIGQHDPGRIRTKEDVPNTEDKERGRLEAEVTLFRQAFAKKEYEIVNVFKKIGIDLEPRNVRSIPSDHPEVKETGKYYEDSFNEFLEYEKALLQKKGLADADLESEIEHLKRREKIALLQARYEAAFAARDKQRGNLADRLLAKGEKFVTVAKEFYANNPVKKGVTDSIRKVLARIGATPRVKGFWETVEPVANSDAPSVQAEGVTLKDKDRDEDDLENEKVKVKMAEDISTTPDEDVVKEKEKAEKRKEDAWLKMENKYDLTPGEKFVFRAKKVIQVISLSSLENWKVMKTVTFAELNEKNGKLSTKLTKNIKNLEKDMIEFLGDENGHAEPEDTLMAWLARTVEESRKIK